MRAKTPEEQQQIEPPPSAYFHMMLNMADDDLNPYQYRLLGHYIRVGKCWEGTRKTAKKTKMSLGMVVKTRQELADLGYIRLEFPETQAETMRVIVLDRMAENVRRYTEGKTKWSDTLSKRAKHVESSSSASQHGDELNGATNAEIFGASMNELLTRLVTVSPNLPLLMGDLAKNAENPVRFFTILSQYIREVGLDTTIFNSFATSVTPESILETLENISKQIGRSHGERGVHDANGGVRQVNERRTNEEEPPKNTNTSAPSAGAEQKTPEPTPPQKPNPYSTLFNAIGAAVFGKSTQAGINAVAGRIAVAVHGKKKGKAEDRYIGILEYECQRTGQKADPDALAIEVPNFWKWFTDEHPGIEMLEGQKIVGRWAEWREKGSPKNKYEAAQKALAARPPAPSSEGEKPKQEWPGDRLKREKAERETAAAQKAGEK